MKKTIPTLLARREGDLLYVWCSFCRREHIHGASPRESHPRDHGHRVAHCVEKNSPYKSTGYFINDRRWTDDRYRQYTVLRGTN